MEPNFKLSRQEKWGLIWRYLKPVIWFFAAALTCACLAMVFNALTPQIIKITVDTILGEEPAALPAILNDWIAEAEPVRALWMAAIAVMVTALLRGVCSYGQRINLSKGSEGFVKGIRDALFDHIQRLSFQWHTAHSTGDMIQRCTSDVDVIRSFVCNQLVEVVRTVFLIGLYLSIMFSMNVKLSVISAIFIPIVGLSSGVFYRRISSRFQVADEAEGELTTCAQENLTGVRVVRAFGRERYEIDKFNEKNERFSKLWIGTLAVGLLGLRYLSDLLAGHGHHPGWNGPHGPGGNDPGLVPGLCDLQQLSVLAGSFPGTCPVRHEQGRRLHGPGGLHSESAP